VAQADWLHQKVSGRAALTLHSSDEPGELLQWQCHDDSTINIAVATTITVMHSATLRVARGIQHVITTSLLQDQCLTPTVMHMHLT